MRTRRVFLTGAIAAASARPQRQACGTIKVSKQRWNAGVAEFRVDNREFALYNYDTSHAGLYRSFVHPLIGPNGNPITQNGEFPGTLRGHYWHRGLFVAHQKVNGISFWEERAEDCGRIVHLGFEDQADDRTRLVERLAWRDLQGRDVINETRTVSIPEQTGAGRSIDVVIRLQASGSPTTLAATPYNLLACRVLDSMAPLALKRKYVQRFGPLASFAPMDQGGLVTNSEGAAGEACRGAKARWCDISGPLGDGTVGGVALLDHPGNPRHPSPFHNWSDLTITASFTFHEPYTIESGQSLTLAYRVFVHTGDARQANIQAAWKAWAKTEPAGMKES